MRETLVKYHALSSINACTLLILCDETALHFAVLTSNFENISFLLSKNANPFLKNANGDKPLELIQNNQHNKAWNKQKCKKKKKQIASKNELYENDADDENESESEDDNNSNNSLSSSSITSHSPMHLNYDEFDQLFHIKQPEEATNDNQQMKKTKNKQQTLKTTNKFRLHC